jgi:hypothetical protein
VPGRLRIDYLPLSQRSGVLFDGSRVVTDLRFGKFADFAGIPIATEVLQYRDGRFVFKEQYADVRVNDAIPEETFDPAKWVATEP